VVSSGASAFTRWLRVAACVEVTLLANFSTVSKVKTASAAVIGLPSDHWAPLRSVNVQVFPSADVVHFVAKSGAKASLASYCTSSG
jgi:hypothetical protein